jgi:membrane-associated protein
VELPNFHDLEGLIRGGGYAALFFIVFAETGLLIGFFLPGDSLLVTAGLLAAVDNFLNIWVLNIMLMAAAIIGDTVGYMIGYHAGPKIFNRPNSWLFHRDHLLRAQKFYEKYGNKTIVLARFVPIVRTFAPTVAGVGRMNYKRFLTYNVLGGIGWVMSMTLLGFFLGRSIPDIEKKMHYVIAVVIFLSFIPIIKEVLHARAVPKEKKTDV